MFTLPTLNLIPIKQLFHIFCKSNWNMNEVGEGKMKQERLYRLPRTIHWIVALPGCFLIRCLNTAIAPNNLLIILTTPFNYKNSNKHSPQLANLGHTIRRHCSRREPKSKRFFSPPTQLKTIVKKGVALIDSDNRRVVLSTFINQRGRRLCFSL